jgi:hypothetical protein
MITCWIGILNWNRDVVGYAGPHPGFVISIRSWTAEARLTEVEVSKLPPISFPDPAQARREFHRIIARDGMTGSPAKERSLATKMSAGSVSRIRAGLQALAPAAAVGANALFALQRSGRGGTPRMPMASRSTTGCVEQ